MTIHLESEMHEQALFVLKVSFGNCSIEAEWIIEHLNPEGPRLSHLH